MSAMRRLGLLRMVQIFTLPGLRIFSTGTSLDSVMPVSRISSTISTSLPVRSASRSLMILTRPVEDVLAPP